VVRAATNAQQGKWALWVLGTKGSLRRLQGQQVATFGTSDKYMAYAKAGLLYAELAPEQGDRLAFSPQVDKATGLPLLLENYEHAFAKRSPEGMGKVAQASIDAPELPTP
jgi:hypothetical protein